MTGEQVTVVKRTQEEFEAELLRVFGEDRATWAFVCPSCGDQASVQDFLDAADKLGLDRNETAGRAGQECIGRTVGDERGCNWAAYGLFRGPEFVVLPDGREIASFPIGVAP